MALFEVELASQWLRQQLQKQVSVHFKLLSICRFFSLFISREDQSKYISYYLQFKEDIFSLIKNFQFQYCSPEEVEDLKNIVDKIFSVSPPIDLNEKGKIVYTLDNAKAEILQLLNENYPAEKKETGSDTYSINQVLIESDPNAKLYAGIIEKLTINTFKNERHDVQDKISFDNNYEDKGNVLQNELENIVSAAKTDAEEEIKTADSYKFNFSYEKKDFLYTGTSQGLGAAVLTFNSILCIEMFKNYYKFRNDVVFGSAIDTNGFLIPLEDEALKLKLKTVFYSEYKKFILPEQNIFEARKLLEELNKKYPDRKLELIPLKHYLSLFKNLDIVDVCRIKLKDKLKVNYNRYHVAANLILSSSIIIVLGILFVHELLPALDRNPVSTELKDNRFAALNKFGKIIWKSEVLSQEDLNIFNSASTRAKRILLSDIDGNGINEILLLIKKENEKRSRRTIFCFNPDNSIKWKTVIPDKDSLYGSDYCSNDINADMIYILNKNKSIVVDFRVCSLYPTFIDKLNLKGEIISEFYNPGTIAQFISDTNSEGNEELIAGGINNDLDKSGAVMVFDPNYITGCAPGYRYPHNYSIGLMKYYLLFPKTDVGRFTNHGSSEVQQIEIHADKIVVYILELDSFQDLENRNQIQRYGTIYTLDRSFNVLHVETSSEFDAKYQQLVNEGKLKPVKDWKKYKEKLVSQVRWWDGDKFVNHPVMNKYYLEAKANLPYKDAIRK